MITCIYKITNSINKRIYIGSAVNFRLRKNRHITSLNKNKHCNNKLQRFVNKYGIDKLSFSILEECEKQKLLEREQFYMDSLECVKKGFNILPIAGSWLNKKHTKASIKKQSLAKKGKATTTGIKHSEQTKDKIRQKAIGRKQSIETIQKRVDKNTGKKRSEKAKELTAIKNSKLSDIDVIKIRELLNDGVFQKEISIMFGVCQRNISRIKQGISYKHIK